MISDIPADQLIFYIVRHGERIDHIDDAWIKNSSTPYDPPLTIDGWEQARKAGSVIRSLETHTDSDFIMLVSPFLRCAQTGQAIHDGFHGGNSSSWRVAVEPGLSEVINENYFHSADNVPREIVAERREDVRMGDVCGNMVFDEGYRPVCEELPAFPENFHAMIARFEAVLNHIATEVIKERRNMRVVVVLVTHGAGITAMRWATTRKLEAGNDVPYCALFKATLAPGSTWMVNSILSPNL